MSGYILAPLDLTERQLLIYYTMYKVADFSNMEVVITTGQIITSIKIIDLTERIVNADIKQMINKGYLKQIKRGNKGTPSTYKIIKINEGNLKVTNTYVKGNLKPSNSNTLEDDEVTNEYVKGNLNVDLIQRNKEKEIINNVVNKLNSLASSNFRPTTKGTINLVKARLKEGFSEEDFYKVIEYKVNEWQSTDFEKFLRPTTLFGTKFEGYLNQANKKAPVRAGTNENKNIKVDSSICKSNKNNTQKVEISKFI